MTYEHYKQKRIEQLVVSDDFRYYDNKKSNAEKAFDGNLSGYIKGGYRSNHTMKILIAEDQLLWADYIRYSFHGPYDIQIATNEQSALEKIANDNFDIVFVDGCLDGKSYQTGTNVAKAAYDQGLYTIGISSKPDEFYKHAKDYLTVNYEKIPERDVLCHLVENRPNDDEWKQYKKENNIHLDAEEN